MQQTKININSNELQYIKGIGPKRAEALIQHGIKSLKNLYYYIPFRYFDRTKICPISHLDKLADNQEITVIGKITNKFLSGTSYRKNFLIKLSDNTGSIDCVWFGGINYFTKLFNVGEIIAVSGVPSIYNRKLQLIHPEYDKLSDEDDVNFFNTGSIIPHYSSSEELKRVNLDSKGFRKILRNLLFSHKFQIDEVLPEGLIKKNNLLPLKDAILNIHFPQSQEMLTKASYRLKYDELFFLQLMVFKRRSIIKVEKEGIQYNVKSKLARRLVDSLHFELTAAQKKVINEIAKDMSSSRAMNRMLQGDVGSGKTIVALLTMLIAVDSNYQAVLMVPTEILAEQHYFNICNLLKNFSLNIRLLVGGQNKKLRNEILGEIAEGKANIVIGTHALIEDNVKFKNVGLIVIDEQHRFGVMQRAWLRDKGINADVLVMTATPIPRTLSLTFYGDLDVSTINELPLNRKKIITKIVTEKNINTLYDFIRSEVKKGLQTYLVYPLIEESEKLDLEAATLGYENLSKNIFPELKIGLIHSKLFGYEKEEIMQKFKSKEINILVATTVIEVGIDVPNATIMVIQNSERFGLAQLHQLRGRVGRGNEQSYCFLVTKDYILSRAKKIYSREEEQKVQIAAKRLKKMEDSTNGFEIAETDLEIRGPGDFFGTRQTGIPSLKVANLIEDKYILEIARNDAKTILEIDPELNLPEHLPTKKIFNEEYSLGINLSLV
jgi:ATP-dependent DNA helicase RecG